jgi:hypothetical protein
VAKPVKEKKKASKSKKNRKFGRNFPKRDRAHESKYVSRMKRRGTFRIRKGKRSKKKFTRAVDGQ